MCQCSWHHDSYIIDTSILRIPVTIGFPYSLSNGFASTMLPASNFSCFYACNFLAMKLVEDVFGSTTYLMFIIIFPGQCNWAVQKSLQDFQSWFWDGKIEFRPAGVVVTLWMANESNYCCCTASHLGLFGADGSFFHKWQN